MHIILTLAFSVVLLLSCNKGNHKSSPSAAPISNDSVLVEQEQEMTGESVDTILITKSADGKKHLFYVDFTDAYNLYSQTVGEWDDERIHFAYDRYEDGNLFYEDGFPGRFHYVVSKDKKYIFVVANIQANGSGWATEYQLFKVDVKTKKTTLIADCAAIEAISDGFIVAKARCINEGTAQSLQRESACSSHVQQQLLQL